MKHRMKPARRPNARFARAPHALFHSLAFCRKPVFAVDRYEQEICLGLGRFYAALSTEGVVPQQSASRKASLDRAERTTANMVRSITGR